MEAGTKLPGMKAKYEDIIQTPSQVKHLFCLCPDTIPGPWQAPTLQ